MRLVTHCVRLSTHQKLTLSLRSIVPLHSLSFGSPLGSRFSTQQVYQLNRLGTFHWLSTPRRTQEELDRALVIHQRKRPRGPSQPSSTLLGRRQSTQQPLLNVSRAPALILKKARYTSLIFSNEPAEPDISIASQKSPSTHSSLKMKSHVEVLSTPTADTPGTALVLEFPDKRYIIGHAHEGCQRIAIERGCKLNKVSDIFLTGNVEWKKTGGLMGLILTTADSRQSASKATAEQIQDKRRQKLVRLRRDMQGLAEGSKQKRRKIEEIDAEERRQAEAIKQEGEEATPVQSMGIHGGVGLLHTIATGRRFIFRKGMPLEVNEITSGANPAAWKPTFTDKNIQVYAMPILPETAPSPRKRTFEESAKPDSDYSVLNTSQRQDILKGVVGDMFNSTWRMDALFETQLKDVKMPAAVFVRDPLTKQLAAWNGLKPGERPREELPDVTVLVRRPWPGALVTDLPPFERSSAAISYIFKNHPQRGKFIPDNAKRLGVPVSSFAQLTEGKSVVLQNGAIVQPEDVLGPTKAGSGFAVVELPSDEYVKPLTERPEWNSDVVMEGVEGIFWILGRGVSQNSLLQGFIQQKSSLKHVISSPDHNANYLAFQSSAASALRLASIDSQRYPFPEFSNASKLPGVFEDGLKNCTLAHPGQAMHLEPKTSWSTSGTVSPLKTAEVYLTVANDVKAISEACRDELKRKDIQEELDAQELAGAHAEIITLGTGSAAPSKYRNVSATLLRVPGTGSYLFDAGENTLGQMTRMFPPAELDALLRDLRMIWISHMHADHHLGITSVIKAWHHAVHPEPLQSDQKELNTMDPGSPQTRLTRQRLFVASDEAMIKWLREYSAVEDFGWEQVVGLNIRPAEAEKPFTTSINSEGIELGFRTSNESINEAMRQATGLADLQAAPVDHCNGARAVSLTFADGFKVSYSGDCRPSKRFVEIGQGTTVLIHEATFDDELKGDARAKKHSTTSEAIKVGLAMGAPRIILTHFSQRYQKLPNMEDLSKNQMQFEDVPENAAEEDLPVGDPGAEGVGRMAGSANSDDTSQLAGKMEDSQPALLQTGLPTEQTAVVPSNANGSAFAKSLRGTKVGVAFDYMRVKVRDIAVLERFAPALAKLLTQDEASEKPEPRKGPGRIGKP